MKNIKRRHEPYTKFKNYLDENDIKQQDIAELLEKSVSAVNQNLNGTGGDFSVSEIRKICLKYRISSDVYFFDQNVSITITQAG